VHRLQFLHFFARKSKGAAQKNPDQEKKLSDLKEKI